MADPLIIRPPSSAPPTRDVVLDGKPLKVFDDFLLRMAINPQKLASGNLDVNELLALSQQSGETQMMLFALIRQLMDAGILKAPPPAPGDDAVGPQMTRSALDDLGLGEDMPDSEKPTVREPMPSKEST